MIGKHPDLEDLRFFVLHISFRMPDAVAPETLPI